ncbi:ATP-binding protein [Streptomyces sp. NPDC007095]|uniref:ATP-binding protein n=1 Tax=Streptomyces sp. NPDC007095 TaxID=3154482 RepID=UPI00340C7BFE
MTARARSGCAFEDVVRARTEADFVEREWLYDEIERALDADRGQYVLVTGEPGTGKTSLLAGMARAHPERLRYFFRRDSRIALTGGDIQSFLLSIGHQLARVRPELFKLEHLEVVIKQHIESVEAEGRVVGIRIEDLSVSPFHRTAILEVEQRVGTLSGEAHAVEIGSARLEPRLLDPDNLAHLALIGPAQVLAAQDPEARIVILLDALDEIADDDTTAPREGLLHWLARSPELPANVKVVITSRPHSGLRLFRAAREDRLTDVVIDAGSPQVVNDLHTYANRVLETDAVIAAERSRGNLPGSTKRYAVHRAAGNFLYLATYARALIDAAGKQNDEMVDRLLVFSGVPGNLPGLYGFFVELVREELAPWPRGPGGPSSGWEGVGLPIIGVLTVAREALSEDQLTALSGTPVREEPARKVLESLRWLLERRSDRIAFFHTSVGEFLAGKEAQEKHPECWVDESRWHERIVRHYRGAAPGWVEVDWTQVDRYGLAHLVAHLLKAGPGSFDEALDLVCPGLRKAVRIEFGAEGRFLELVDSIAHHVADTAPVATGLPAMTYLAVVRHQAAQSSGALTPRAIGLLARMDRLKEALEHAAGIRPSLWQFTAFAEILQYAHPKPGDPSPDDLLDLLVESALTIPRRGGFYGNRDAERAAEAAARLVAPHDLERALRLWRHGRDAATRESLPEEEPDAVYRAAVAAEQDVDKARSLLDRISGERWADYLDLAERTAPARALELLRAAESCLATVDPATRVLALARLASAWAAHNPDMSRRFLAEVRAQVFDAGDERELAPRLAEAAGVLADVDRTTARFLLARLDTAVLDGISQRAILDGVRLWTRWERPERARTLADRYLAKALGDWERLDVMKALGRSSRAKELRLVEGIYAALPEPPADLTAYAWRSSDRDDQLIRVVRTMAEYDVGRAEQMARGIAGTTWGDDWYDRDWALAATAGPAQEILGDDRYSVLAGIAHLRVTRGQGRQAAALLQELLERGETPTPPRGGAGVGADFASSLPASGEPPARNDLEQMNPLGFGAMFNLSHAWAARVRDHFFRDPADVVRAVELYSSGNAARVVRRLAERLAHRDRSVAGAVVGSLADPGERAIGFAELHRAAHGPVSSYSHHWPEADEFSKEVDRALGELPRYRWTVSDTHVAEQEAWAYARPDHRVRFELAVRALGCRAEDGKAIRDLTCLSFTQLFSQRVWISEAYAADVIDKKGPQEPFARMHLENLSLQHDLNRRDLAEIMAAACAYHEYRIAREVPKRRIRTPKVRLDNPVYAAAVDLVRPAPGAPLSPSFIERLRKLLDAGTLPAAAELLAFAADVRPENRHTLRELATEVIAKAGDGSALGVDALAALAVSPVLGDLVDPVGLLREAERCDPRYPFYEWIPRHVVVRLFPVLLERAPAVALRKFYESASGDWSSAMWLLEHAPDALLKALGTGAAATLGSAIDRGLACTSPEGVAPDVVDGVRLAQLVATGPTERGQAS